ncbi:putative rubber elongation factor [Helianthus anomalus]
MANEHEKDSVEMLEENHPIDIRKYVKTVIGPIYKKFQDVPLDLLYLHLFQHILRSILTHLQQLPTHNITFTYI